MTRALIGGDQNVRAVALPPNSDADFGFYLENRHSGIFFTKVGNYAIPLCVAASKACLSRGVRPIGQDEGWKGETRRRNFFI
jgi:hypothetical protein